MNAVMCRSASSWTRSSDAEGDVARSFGTVAAGRSRAGRPGRVHAGRRPVNANEPAPPTLMVDPTMVRQLVEDFGTERAQGLVERFVDELRLQCSTAVAAVASKDAQGVYQAAHTIRGMAASFGCGQLVALCDDLRIASDSGDAALRDALALQLDGQRLQVRAAFAALRRDGGVLSRGA